MTACSVDDCHSPAVSWIRFANMGPQLHAHVCGPHEAIDREFADVIEGGPLPCPERLACAAPVLRRTPPLLES